MYKSMKNYPACSVKCSFLTALCLISTSLCLSCIMMFSTALCLSCIMIMVNCIIYELHYVYGKLHNV